MIKAENFVPGRIYSVIYDSDVDMVGKREGNVNPMEGAQVTVRRVSTVQAAGNKTWENFKRKNGIETDTTRPAWWTVTPSNSCIVAHNKTGVTYLRGLPRGITKENYMVNGIEATPAQVETIRAFKKSKGESNFVLLTLAKLVNVGSGEGEAE